MKKCLYAGWLASPGNLTEYLGSNGIELVNHAMERHCTEDELAAFLVDADASIAGGDPYSKRVLDSAPKLKIIARVGVGYDRVDVAAATAKGIYVTTSPVPELAYGMAEHTMALLLSLVKRVPPRDAEMRAGIWETARWREQIEDLYHLTLGLLGVGRIGAETAKRARAFGMNLIYYDVVRRPELEQSLGMRFVSFDELLSQADVLSIHLPLSAQTTHLIDAKALGKMKKTALIVNTARGPIIDEEALLAALKEGRIAGAALDVFSAEPLTKGHPFYALGEALPNLVLTPHHGIGMHTVQAMMRGAAEDVVRVLNEQKPLYAINQVGGGART